MPGWYLSLTRAPSIDSPSPANTTPPLSHCFWPRIRLGIWKGVLQFPYSFVDRQHCGPRRLMGVPEHHGGLVPLLGETAQVGTRRCEPKCPPLWSTRSGRDMMPSRVPVPSRNRTRLLKHNKCIVCTELFVLSSLGLGGSPSVQYLPPLQRIVPGAAPICFKPWPSPALVYRLAHLSQGLSRGCEMESVPQDGRLCRSGEKPTVSHDRQTA